MKKLISILLCLALVFAMSTALASCNQQANENSGDDIIADAPNTPTYTTEENYARAISMIESGDYEGAKALFEKLGDYKDANDYLKKFYYMPISFEYDLIDKKGTNPVTYNDKNLPASESTKREGVDAISEFDYDENGNFVKQTATNNGAVSSYEYFYDNEGRFVAAHGSFGEGVYADHTYEYDNNNNLIKETYSDSYGNTYKYLYFYNENGDVSKKETIHSGVVYELTVDYTYDDNGRITHEVCSYSDGTVEYYDYTYDENGNRTSEVFTDADGIKTRYDYKYDGNNNMIEEIYTDADGVVQYVKVAYKLFYIPSGITKGTEIFLIGFWSTRL